MKAVLEFYKDLELCYVWLSFLLLLDNDIDDFWSPLALLIRDLITEILV